VTRYVLDHHAVIAGLTDAGSEHHHRELSRLLVGAIGGGPALAVPALCLAATAGIRPAVAEHLADLIVSAAPGVITVPGLEHTPPLDAVRQTYPHLDWPATHAITTALAVGATLITTHPAFYTGVPLHVVDL
jgi:hypothetical protein